MPSHVAAAAELAGPACALDLLAYVSLTKPMEVHETAGQLMLTSQFLGGAAEYALPPCARGSKAVSVHAVAQPTAALASQSSTRALADNLKWHGGSFCNVSLNHQRIAIPTLPPKPNSKQQPKGRIKEKGSQSLQQLEDPSASTEGRSLNSF